MSGRSIFRAGKARPKSAQAVFRIEEGEPGVGGSLFEAEDLAVGDVPEARAQLPPAVAGAPEEVEVGADPPVRAIHRDPARIDAEALRPAEPVGQADAEVVVVPGVEGNRLVCDRRHHRPALVDDVQPRAHAQIRFGGAAGTGGATYCRADEGD